MIWWALGAAFFGIQLVIAVVGLFAGGSFTAVLFPGVLTLVCGLVTFNKYKVGKTHSAALIDNIRQAQDQIAQIQGGSLPVVQSGIRLYQGETVHFSATGELLESQTVGYRGGTAGVSVRVAKGVTVRSGSIKGGAIKDMVVVASGEFAATSARLVFAGNLKSFDVKLGKVNHIEKLDDGLIVHADGKARIIKLLCTNASAQLGQAVIDKLLQDNPMQ
jgi:hypothetical protein